MNKYELLYIIDNELEAEAKDALIAKFSDIVVNDGGSVETIDKWGTKKLAYPINFKNEGCSFCKSTTPSKSTSNLSNE